MTDFDPDPWIKSKSELGYKRLHALGVIAFQWNRSEFWLFSTFCDVSGYEEDDAWALVYDLGDIAIYTRIKTFLKRRSLTVEAPLIENALEVYLPSEQKLCDACLATWRWGKRRNCDGAQKQKARPASATAACMERAVIGSSSGPAREKNQANCKCHAGICAGPSNPAPHQLSKRDRIAARTAFAGGHIGVKKSPNRRGEARGRTPLRRRKRRGRRPCSLRRIAPLRDPFRRHDHSPVERRHDHSPVERRQKRAASRRPLIVPL
jgi:hypothetical protein